MNHQTTTTPGRGTRTRIRRPGRPARLTGSVGGVLATAMVLTGVQLSGAMALEPRPVRTATTQAPGSDGELMLEVIERFVDRTEDFWREEQGTFVASGSGVTQPRGEGNIAMAYATLLTARPDQQAFGTEQHDRSVLLAHAESTIRHAAGTNRSQGGPWGGGSWQASIETYGWGLAAYLLRDQLTTETLELVGEVVRYEADILIDKPAADATAGNTGAEDNAWNSPLPALAAGWWPEHANADQWREAAQRFAVNASTIPGDTEDEGTVVDGRPLSEWAETTNLLPDLTMENHGFFNPIYQQVAGFNLGEGILIHEITGQEVPEAFEFRTERIYDEILAPLVTPDGDLLLTHGQDWVAKDYQHLGYLTMMGTWYGRADATEYAGRALQNVASRQAARTDGAILGQDAVGYETMLVKRLAAAYLMNQHLGPAATTDAVGLAQIEAEREGVHLFPASKFAVHRLDGTLRSMNWTTTRPMALLVPDGTLHQDPVLAHYRPGNLIGDRASTDTDALCDCGDDSFAVAQMVDGRGYAVASLPNGLMAALEAGTGRAFPVALENIEGVTGDRPVLGPDGPITGTADVPWFSIDGRLGMIVQGGAGVQVERGLTAGANRIDVVTGSVAGGDGNRAAVMLADHTEDQVAQVAAGTSRPEVPQGWQAVQATALDGTVGVLAARFGGPSEAAITLAGGPVLPSGVMLDGGTSRWDVALEEVAARAEVAPATATSTAPVTASAPRPDLVVLRNDGDLVAEVTITFAAGAEVTGQVPASGSAVAVLSGDQVLFGNPALVELTGLPSGGPAIDRLVSRAIDALVDGNENQALNHISLALRKAEGTDLTPGLSSAAATLVGLSLTVPDSIELIRTDEPHQVQAQLDWAPGDWRTATSAALELTSDLAGAPVQITDNRLRPGETLTATIELAADSETGTGELTARAHVRLGPGTLVLEERTTITTLAPLEVTVNPEAISVGGAIERTIEITVTNRLARQMHAEVSIVGPDGLRITPDTGQVTVPGHGQGSATATLVRDGIPDGRHTLGVTATPDHGGAVQVDVPLHTSDQLALNPFGTGYPAATATSEQGPYPAGRANDGDLGTFWVSAGTQDGEGPTPQNPEVLTIDLGAPTTVGSVDVVPRPGYGPRAMTIEGRVDGAWVQLAQVLQPNATATHAVPSTVVDAVRLVVTSVYDARGRNVQVVEMRLSAESPPPPPENVAHGAETEASSNQDAYPSGLAVDGTPGTFWVSAAGATPDEPQWLSIDLGRDVEISRLVVVPRLNGANDHGPRHLVWQVGDGAGGWTDLVEREKSRGATDSVDVEVTARHVRLLITSVWDARNQNVQVAEAQVFGR